MKLNQFLSIIDQYLCNEVMSSSASGRVTKEDKLKTYLNAFISINDDDKNPIDDLSSDFSRKVFNGTEALPQNCASFIRGNLDSSTFESFSSNLSVEAIDHIISEFEIFNIKINATDFEQGLTDTLDDIMYYIVNVSPSTSIRDSEFISDNKVRIGGKTIKLYPKLVPTENILEKEMPYVDALMRVYSQAAGLGPLTVGDLKSLEPQYEEHFKFQRKTYFSADSVLHQIRDIYEDGEEEFNIMKDETFDGIFSVMIAAYNNAFERVNRTMNHAVTITYGRSYLARQNVGLIGNSEKQGIIHMLVNDGRIEWVVDYDKNI
jgi:hypothetical protein